MTDQITYVDARAGLKGTVYVYLGKRKIGCIFKRPEGFVYVPKGQRDSGEPFPTLRACKDSLEAE